MRILAVLSGHGPSRGRLLPAAAGLALRGHTMGWIGGGIPAAASDAIRPLPAPRDRWTFRADVVVSDAPSPVAPALAGWRSGAACLVMDLEHERVRRWGLPAHVAWHSLHSQGLVEAAEAAAFRERPAGLEIERLALWSDDSPAAGPDPAHPDAEILERACERALARHRSRAPRPAVFLDRDGTLVREVGYLSDPGELQVLPGVPGALRMLQAAGYMLVVVSNQSGVGRGLFSLTRVHEAMACLRAQLRAAGVEIDAVYFCPHHPDAGCACRKPGTGLLLRAADDLRLALRDSVMVGDKLLDVDTAHRAGSAGVLVRTGYGREEESRAGEGGPRPEAVCEDLAAAAQWILARLAAP